MAPPACIPWRLFVTYSVLCMLDQDPYIRPHLCPVETLDLRLANFSLKGQSVNILALQVFDFYCNKLNSATEAQKQT